MPTKQPNIWIDELLDNLKAHGFSYQMYNYIDSKGALWLQVAAQRGEEKRFYRVMVKGLRVVRLFPIIKRPLHKGILEAASKTERRR